MTFESVLAFLSNPMVLTPIGLAVGGWLKKVPWFNTKAVPVMNLLIAMMVKSGAAIVVPAQAFSFPGPGLGVEVVTAGLGGTLLAIFWESFLQAALTTGIHSGAKNAAEAAIGGKVKW